MKPADFLDVNAAMSDPFANKEYRLAFLRRALLRDPDPAYRKQIVREYLDLTNPEIQEPDF